MLPVPTPTNVLIEMVGRRFEFRRLTWKDEVEFQHQRSTSPTLHILAFAMSLVDGKPIRPDDALRIVTALPRPIRERMTKMFLAGLPRHRVVEIVRAPDPAPVPAEVQRRAKMEVAEQEQEGDDALTRQFGSDEAEYARDQEQQIAQASGMRGASRAVDESPLPPRVPPPEVEDSEDEDCDVEDTISILPATKYHSVM